MFTYNMEKDQHIEELNRDLRPTSLTPTLSKIVEEYVVKEHLKSAVLNYYHTIIIRFELLSLDPTNMAAFLFHLLHMYTLIYLIHHWLETTDVMGSKVRVILMDFKKAFDLINHMHNLVISKLKSDEINPYTINWVDDFFE